MNSNNVSSSSLISLTLLLLINTSVSTGRVKTDSITVSTQRAYVCIERGAAADTPPWCDRPYKIHSLTAGLQGCDLLQTSVSDDSVTTADHLTFILDEEAYVVVGYLGTAERLPSWLQGWTRTEEEAVVEVLGGLQHFTTYVKQFPTGSRVVLGGNCGMQTSAKSHYLVFINPFRSDIPAPRIDHKRKAFQLTAKVVDLKHVSLQIKSMLPSQKRQNITSITVHRSQCPAREIGYASPKAANYISLARYEDAQVIDVIEHIRFDADGSTVYEDHQTTKQMVYAYWISVNDEDYIWGPVVLKVRDPEVWMTHESIEERANALATGHPRLIQKVSFGKTVQGRPINSWVIGKANNAVALIGNVHAGESGGEIIIRVAERLLKEAPRVFRETGLIILPVLNIDNRTRLVEGHIGYLRRNANNVDLNRNFEIGWQHVNGASKGPRPMSEPETRAVDELLRRHRPRALFTFHQTGCIAGWRADTVSAALVTPAVNRRIERYAKAYYDGYNFDGTRTIPFKFGRSPKHGRIPAHTAVKYGICGFDLEGDHEPEFLISNEDLVTPQMMTRNVEQHYHAILNVLRMTENPR